MIEIILYSSLGVLVLTVVLLIDLVRKFNQLKQTLSLLEQKVNRNSRDIAGLCSAAVSVDQRVQGTDEILTTIREKIEHSQNHSLADENISDYQNAIDKIQRGASVDELIDDYGLKGEEAALLLRMHGR